HQLYYYYNNYYHLDVQLWASIIKGVIDSVKVALPDEQYLHLRVLSRMCIHPPFVEMIKNQDGQGVAVRLLRSINDAVSGEASVLLMSMAHTRENKIIIGSTSGAVPGLVDLIWRTQNELTMEQAVTALWTLATVDKNKQIIRDAG